MREETAKLRGDQVGPSAAPAVGRPAVVEVGELNAFWAGQDLLKRVQGCLEIARAFGAAEQQDGEFVDIYAEQLRRPISHLTT